MIPMRKSVQSAVEYQRGSVLLEALVAVLVFSVGLLGLAGFQAAAVRAQTDARARADAAFVANQMVGDMWSLSPGALADCSGTYDATSTGCGGKWGDRIAQSLPDGSAVVAVNDTQVTITLSWKMPGAGETHNYVHVANIVRN